MNPIKQAIEALPPLPAAKTLSRGDEDGAIQLGYTADQMREYALAVLRSMPQGEPVAIYQYQIATGAWIDQTKDSHDYNVRHGQATVRIVYATPHTEAVRMSEAEIDDLAVLHLGNPGIDPTNFARAVEQATAARLGVKLGDV